MQSMSSQLERERQRRILDDRRVKEDLQKAEEQERERLRAEKRAAKVRSYSLMTSRCIGKKHLKAENRIAPSAPLPKILQKAKIYCRFSI